VGELARSLPLFVKKGGSGSRSQMRFDENEWNTAPFSGIDFQPAMRTYSRLTKNFGSQELFSIGWRKMPVEVSSQSTKKQLILCIDDHKPGLHARKLLLETVGYDVITASSGKIGLLQRRPVQFIILDYRMPEMDGGAVAHEIRRVCPEVPIIMLSGYLDVPDSVLSAVDAFVSKGQPPEVLLGYLSMLSQAGAPKHPPTGASPRNRVQGSAADTLYTIHGCGYPGGCLTVGEQPALAPRKAGISPKMHIAFAGVKSCQSVHSVPIRTALSSPYPNNRALPLCIALPRLGCSPNPGIDFSAQQDHQARDTHGGRLSLSSRKIVPDWFYAKSGNDAGETRRSHIKRLQQRCPG
jgi:CheY-like chemotaxis protein